MWSRGGRRECGKLLRRVTSLSGTCAFGPAQWRRRVGRGSVGRGPHGLHGRCIIRDMCGLCGGRDTLGVWRGDSTVYQQIDPLRGGMAVQYIYTVRTIIDAAASVF